MDLKRELSHVSRQASKHESKLEEGGPKQEDVFDLDEFLHGMNNEAQAAGAKPKHLGLIWKDLVVEVCSRTNESESKEYVMLSF